MDIESKADNAINEALKSKEFFCKFLTANDSGASGGHQSGILISSTLYDYFFEKDKIRCSSPKKLGIKVSWDNSTKTDSAITWYPSKKELRLTRFGRGFDLINPKETGSLFVLIRQLENEYQAYILQVDDEIQKFLDSFGLTPIETNRLIKPNKVSDFQDEIDSYIKNCGHNFPSTFEISDRAKELLIEYKQNNFSTLKDPDQALIQWNDIEYDIFKKLEESIYGQEIFHGFSDIEEFIKTANSILNRRKSRAGKGLENHLASIFDDNEIRYTAQGITEGNKRPDFVFPSIEAYHDINFLIENLCSLAAKTTCKDRWRQILNEGDRFRDQNKYLCTLQRGISEQQLNEMKKEKVVLVVPKVYIKEYPQKKRSDIMTISEFIKYVKSKQEN